MRILSPQHMVFVDEYLTSFNASKSAIKAGFAPTYANRIGYELLQREDIKNELGYVMHMRFDQNKMERRRIINELEKVAFADMKDYIKWSEDGIQFIDPAVVDGTVIAEVSINPNGRKTIKLADKLKAIELLGKHYGMFTERVKHDGNVMINIIDDIAELAYTPIPGEMSYIEQ